MTALPLPLAKELVPAGAEFPLLPAAVACTVLAVTALVWLRVFSRGFLHGRRPAEHEPLPPGGTAGSASRSQLLHLAVLFFGMGAVLHADTLVAAAEHHLHPAAVVCAVIAFAVLFNSAILRLNFGLAAVGSSNPARSAFSALAALMRQNSPYSPTAPSAERKGSRPAATPPPIIAEAQPPIAPALRPHQSRLARAAFVILSALISTSWFLEPVAAAAAELRVPRSAVVAILVVFATCFFTSLHIFRSFFLPRPPAAAAQQWEGIAVIAAVGAGVAACLVAAGGSAYGCAPARS
ncbi:hypothetical protein U9M48_014531 [Paspalum notatum var. saurae]|uniref:Uncharacterized protein n=1 Tax=Paspalum notatum var. saurae TaxID=547442 RepID=A0AAQ3T1S2_PASNO